MKYKIGDKVSMDGMFNAEIVDKYFDGYVKRTVYTLKSDTAIILNVFKHNIKPKVTEWMKYEV